jgi:AAA domain/Primase C terminal 2 (PriCT-2)
LQPTFFNAATRLPDELLARRNWILWKLVPRPDKKPLKVPYYAKGGVREGKQGTESDIAKLATFGEAYAKFQSGKFAGLGFAPTPGCGLVFLDFDNCVTPAGVIDARIETLCGGTYAEVSPSGTGVRAIFLGDVGNHKAPTTPDQCGVETFSSNGFVTITGNVMPSTELLGYDLQRVGDQLTRYLAKRFERSVTALGTRPMHAGDNWLATQEPRLGLTVTDITKLLGALPPDASYPDWVRYGMAVHYETAASDEGFEAWHTWSTQGAKYVSRDECYAKWLSFGQADLAPVTARTLVKEAGDLGVSIASGSEEFEDLSTQAGSSTVKQSNDVAPDTSGEQKTIRYLIEPAHQFAVLEPTPWIIKGLLPRGEFSMLAGQSGDGKSFTALQMAYHVTTGIAFENRKCHRSRVLYLAAEGSSGMRKRLLAMAKHHDIDLSTLPLDILRAAPNMLQRTDAIDLAKAMLADRGFGFYSLIIVDTFAQVVPGGNENAAEDMGKALANLKGIHQATGATVLVVHHIGKDASKGARGWSGLFAAADSVIEVTRLPGGRMARLAKQKDGEDHIEWGFELTVVELGLDEDGDIITSCVAVPAAMPTGGFIPSAMGSVERVVFDVVSEMAIGQNTGIEISAVLDEAIARMEPPDTGKRDTRKSKAKRALLNLSEGDTSPFFIEEDCITVV